MVAPLNSKWVYLVSAILLVVANLALYTLGRAGKDRVVSADLQRLPLVINGWEGREIPISERDRQMLGTPNILFRQYRKGEGAVNLFILESASNRSSFHPPEYCYVAGRTQMTAGSLRNLSWEGGTVSANRFIFQGPHGQSLVYYWYACGSGWTPSYYRQQLLVISHLLFGNVQPAFVIRLSVEGEFDIAAGDGVISWFIREVMPEISATLISPLGPDKPA